MSADEFTVVGKKPRKPKAPEIKERILVCRDAYDWDGYEENEGPDFVGEITTIKDLESFAEKKRLPWYYHGFSPARKMIFTCIKGKKSEFEAPDDYIQLVITRSNAPKDIIDQLKVSKSN